MKHKRAQKSKKNLQRLRRRPPLNPALPMELQSYLKFDIYNSDRQCQVRLGWLFQTPGEDESDNLRTIKPEAEETEVEESTSIEENNENDSDSSVLDSMGVGNEPRKLKENYIARINHRCEECRGEEQEHFSHYPIGQVIQLLSLQLSEYVFQTEIHTYV